MFPNIPLCMYFTPSMRSTSNHRGPGVTEVNSTVYIFKEREVHEETRRPWMSE